MKAKDFTGERFGRLIVLSRAENKNHRVMWLCQCDCGNRTTVQANHLSDGSTLSCGKCANARNSRLYKSVWNKLFQRCYNQNCHDYKNYGGRGIKVCDDWHSYLSFRNWAVANGYDEAAPYGVCTLDRIDVNGDYCPENCRFVDLTTQCRNKQYNHFVTYNGRTKTIAEWADISGISASALYNRFNRGWSPERAFTQPVRVRGVIRHG